MFKKLFNSVQISIASNLIYLYTKFCFITARKQYINKELFDSVSTDNTPVIYNCWHGRLYIVPQIKPKNKTVKCIVSNNKDGEIIARVLHKNGFQTIRGSSNKKPINGKGYNKDKQGAKVIVEAIRALKNNISIGLIPDGPKGPNQKFKANSLAIAVKSGAKILTFSYSTTKPITFNSWDNFMLPKPFSKIVVIFGEFYTIEKDSTAEQLERYSKMIENNLNLIQDEADRLCDMKK